MKSLKSSIRILSIGALIVTATVVGVEAQQTRSWQAFTGCWMSAQEGAEDTVLCFRPSGEGVEVSTVVYGEVTGTEFLVADGQQRSLQADACTGGQTVEFSSDGRRVFIRSELTCEGEPRTNSGLMALASPTRLIHFREVDFAGEPVSWFDEYRPVARRWFDDYGIVDPSAANRQDVLAARSRAAQAITIPDVEEAATRLPAGALQLWIAVMPSRFRLDGDAILDLAGQGVPESVIDVMVAADFPDRFALYTDGGAATITEQQPNPESGVAYAAPYPVIGYRSYLFDPFFVSPFYGYGAFGYPYGPYLYPPYGYTTSPVTIIVEPQPETPTSQGRMINGQGYRRNGSSTTGAAMPSASGRVSTRSAPATSGRVSTVSAPAPSQTSSSSGDSGSSGSSTPRSSSATPTGRTAQPRN